jgi:UTP--glucose-1-phosphate uridylyltransferase
VSEVKETRTAVFPVAGRGTRFLPATKASPKEMLPIVDKPLIQYAAEEALAAGARKLVFITGSSKRAIEDHFDSDHELEEALEAQGKTELLKALKDIVPSWASCIYIRQPSPLGLGHAVWCAPMPLTYFNFRANFIPAGHPAFKDKTLVPLDPQPKIFKLPPKEEKKEKAE